MSHARPYLRPLATLTHRYYHARRSSHGSRRPEVDHAAPQRAAGPVPFPSLRLHRSPLPPALWLLSFVAPAGADFCKQGHTSAGPDSGPIPFRLVSLAALDRPTEYTQNVAPPLRTTTWPLLTHPNGVQGVAGSDPAVPTAKHKAPQRFLVAGPCGVRGVGQVSEGPVSPSLPPPVRSAGSVRRVAVAARRAAPDPRGVVPRPPGRAVAGPGTHLAPATRQSVLGPRRAARRSPSRRCGRASQPSGQISSTLPNRLGTSRWPRRESWPMSAGKARSSTFTASPPPRSSR